MKKISTLLMLLCIVVFSANAQLLWKVSGKDLSQPSYIFGTHHLAPISITDSIAGFKQAMNETQQVYGELLMEKMQTPENIQKMQQAVVMPGDTTLHTLFNESQYDSVAVVIKQLMGIDLKMLDKMKPAFISNQMALILAMKVLKGFNPQEQLDTWVQSEAKKSGKATAGLETMDFQMHVLFNSQSLQRQAEQLIHSVINMEQMEKQVLKITSAYMSQDLKKLETAFTEKMGNASDPLPEEEETLIYGRNANWAKIMPAIMKEKPTLFAVGSGHLPGERGVLNLLKQQGYTIEPVK